MYTSEATAPAPYQEDTMHPRPLRSPLTQRVRSLRTPSLAGTLLVVAGLMIGFAAVLATAAASASTGSHPPIDPYLIDRTTEVALARRDAPSEVSQAATVMALGANGFETVAEGSILLLHLRRTAMVAAGIALDEITQTLAAELAEGKLRFAGDELGVA
jgi:hypothetical protein